MKTRARVHRAIHRELALLGVQDVEVRVSSTNGGLLYPGHVYVRIRPTRGRLFIGLRGHPMMDTWGWVPRTKRSKAKRGRHCCSAKAMAAHVGRFGASRRPGSIDRPIEAQRLANERARLTALTPRSSLRRIVGEN